jgi:hypothetical protein
MKDDPPEGPAAARRDPEIACAVHQARTSEGDNKAQKRQPVRLVLPSKSGIPAWSLAFAGTLFASVFLLVATRLPVLAVELVNPHAVLEETRRHLMDFDKRMQRYKAERQKDEKELQARQKREEAERREREKTEKALAEAQRKRDAAEQQKRMREEKEQAARRKQEEAERQKREALQETQRQRDVAEEQKRAIAATEQEARQKQEDAEREKTKEALQDSQRQREAAAELTKAQEQGAASKPREGLRGMLSNREDRRSACRQQAEERGLSGRKASRYTRLCVSGLPIPKTLSR